MIGLPTEDMSDIEGIVDISKRILKASSNRMKVNLHITPFVPKPHTPFQWRAQLGLEDMYKILRYIRKRLNRPNIEVKWQDPFSSVLEGVFARGDRRLSSLLFKAFKLGCHFDGWKEHLRKDLWLKAFKESEIDIDSYIRERDHDEVLPWDHIDPLVKKDFLILEDRKGSEGVYTPDCRFNQCSNCGVCKNYGLKNITAEHKSIPLTSRRSHKREESKRRIRLKFSKFDLMRYVSHLELINIIHRAVRRAKIPVIFSQGFHPMPRIIFGPPLPIGVESVSEYVDLEVYGPLKISELIKDLNKELPHGLEILEGREVSIRGRSLSESISKFLYRISPRDTRNNNEMEDIKERIKNMELVHKDNRTIPLRECLEDLYLSEGSLYMMLKLSKNGWVNPIHILKNLNLEPQAYNILKVNTIFYE